MHKTLCSLWRKLHPYWEAIHSISCKIINTSRSFSKQKTNTVLDLKKKNQIHSDIKQIFHDKSDMLNTFNKLNYQISKLTIRYTSCHFHQKFAIIANYSRIISTLELWWYRHLIIAFSHDLQIIDICQILICYILAWSLIDNKLINRYEMKGSDYTYHWEDAWPS